MKEAVTMGFPEHLVLASVPPSEMNGEKPYPGLRKANSAPCSVSRFLLDLLYITESLTSFVPL